jgi:hypothetical protein
MRETNWDLSPITQGQFAPNPETFEDLAMAKQMLIQWPYLS